MGRSPDRSLVAHGRSRAGLIVASLVIAGALTAARADRFHAAPTRGESLAAALAAELRVDPESLRELGRVSPLGFTAILFRGWPLVEDGEAPPADLYVVSARLAGASVLEWRFLTNLTRTSSADEDRPIAVGPDHVAYLARVGQRVDAFTILDLRGEPRALTRGWPARARLQNAITNFQSNGRALGFGRTRFAFGERPAEVSLSVDGSGEATHAVVRWSDEGGSHEVRVDPRVPGDADVGEEIELRPEAKGMPGTITWVVDTVRNLSFVGSEPIAWLENRVFNLKDALQRGYYAIVGEPDSAETEAEVAEEMGLEEEISDEETRRRAELSQTDPELGWPPAPLESIIDRPARGEGEWQPIVDDPFVRSYPNAPPTFFNTYMRVDPERLFAKVFIVIWDPRAVQLRVMSGTREPESATGETGPGLIPRDEETLERVVAGFNGGFQALHGEFGMMAEGRVYLPPKPWAATLTVHESGQVGMGSWLGPPNNLRYYAESWAVRQIPDDVVDFRQNLTSVVEGETYNPWGRWFWGAAPRDDEEQSYIDRSGICMTEEGFFAYFWGKSMGPEQLGNAMLATRCVRGMHLDMNQRHTAFELYNAYREDEATPLPRPPRRGFEFDENLERARGWRVRGRKLVRPMTPMRFPRYVRRDPRDYFYLTLRPVLPGPDLAEMRAPAGESDGDVHEGRFVSAGLPHSGWPPAFARTFLGSSERSEGVDAEAARTWFVRIDPARARPGDSGPMQVDPNPDPAARVPEPTVLAHLSGRSALAAGSRALYGLPPGTRVGRRRRPQIGWRFRVGEPPEGSAVALRGELLGPESTAGAAIGVDHDGFIVYAERNAGDVVSLHERMRSAGITEAIALPDACRLAFAIDGRLVAPDAYERAVDLSDAIDVVADITPMHGFLFPEVTPMPYRNWGPLQDSRVRYFRDGGPSRFRAPNAPP